MQFLLKKWLTPIIMGGNDAIDVLYMNILYIFYSYGK